jgi:hypothetical protein
MQLKQLKICADFVKAMGECPYSNTFGVLKTWDKGLINMT